MAITWKWKEKCGEIVAECETANGMQEHTFNMYNGNCLMVAIDEFNDENGTDMYNLYAFFADKIHARRCFGCDRKWGSYGDNLYDRPYHHWTKVRINTAVFHDYKTFVLVLTEAFKSLTIELYNEPLQND